MPLEILVPFVIVAVSVIMLVIVRSGLSRRARLGSAEAAASRFAIDFPDCAIADTLIADDGRAALLIMRESEAVGLVRAIGDRTTTRLLNAGDLSAVIERDNGLIVTSTDFTWPRQGIRLADAADRVRWREVLLPLCGEAHADRITA